MLGVALLIAVAVGGDLHSASGAGLRTKALAAGVSREQTGVHALPKLKKQPEIDQQLVVCNAYASPGALDIYHVQTLDRLTGSAPLTYKECREFAMGLQEGDQLDFKSGDRDVGTFYATGLPTSSASLLLIPHRRDGSSRAITFESHAFADLQSPQIAVVDAYKGKGEGMVKIMDSMPEAGADEPVEEMLKFRSVVAVNPGNYKVALTSLGDNSTAVAPDIEVQPLLVESQAKYVVMRVGVESAGNEKHKYPEELVVFPGGAFRLSLAMGAIAVSVLSAAFTSDF